MTHASYLDPDDATPEWIESTKRAYGQALEYSCPFCSKRKGQLCSTGSGWRTQSHALRGVR